MLTLAQHIFKFIFFFPQGIAVGLDNLQRVMRISLEASNNVIASSLLRNGELFYALKFSHLFYIEGFGKGKDHWVSLYRSA